ncbi:MAG: Gfo/Idh/MocA family oxidoreductase, partial [Lachnospiraceae bacterium]|nr:Gfo/Idh/MocA family oxidoreductase [Lachnospiraceae bacterium]
MSRIRWGILGTANIASWGMIPGMKKAGNCELYAIAGRNPDKAEMFKDKFGFEKAYGSYDELLKDEDVQAVYIPLPNNIHKEWVIAALRAGKHVLCEKPMAMNAAESEEMYKAAKESGRILMEAYAYLHSPYVKSLKETVKSGVIGEVDYIDTAFITQGYNEDFRLHKELGGGAMYDLGCYCTTMILSLIDSEPVFVKASAEFSELGVDYLTVAAIGFENGARASFNAGMILGKGTGSRFDRLYIHGTKGSIRSDVEYNQEGELSYRIYTPGSVKEETVLAPNNYALEIEQFGRCILEGETPYVSAEFSVKNAKLIDAVLKET